MKHPPTDKTDKTRFGSFVSDPPGLSWAEAGDLAVLSVTRPTSFGS